MNDSAALRGFAILRQVFLVVMITLTCAAVAFVDIRTDAGAVDLVSAPVAPDSLAASLPQPLGKVAHAVASSLELGMVRIGLVAWTMLTIPVGVLLSFLAANRLARRVAGAAARWRAARLQRDHERRRRGLVARLAADAESASREQEATKGGQLARQRLNNVLAFGRAIEASHGADRLRCMNGLSVEIDHLCETCGTPGARVARDARFREQVTSVRVFLIKSAGISEGDPAIRQLSRLVN